jgi:hypothetical protein
MTIGHSVTPTYKSTIKLQHHTNSNYNIATTTITDLGHPAIIHTFLALYPSHQSPKSMHHRLTIHGPHMQHDTDDQNYERNRLVHHVIVMCLLQLVHF